MHEINGFLKMPRNILVFVNGLRLNKKYRAPRRGGFAIIYKGLLRAKEFYYLLKPKVPLRWINDFGISTFGETPSNQRGNFCGLGRKTSLFHRTYINS